VNVAGFATYYIYPAAPPWYTAAYGLGPAQLGVSASPAAGIRWDQLTGLHYFAGFYGRSADVFGAIPSLHVAYPLLVALYASRLRRVLLDVIHFGFFGLVCFAAVYLQHHYVVDVLTGVLYALLGYGVERSIHRVRTRRRLAAVPAARDSVYAVDAKFASQVLTKAWGISKKGGRT
jgi:hypothetical protein